MKITKSQLRNIIREEIHKLNENTKYPKSLVVKDRRGYTKILSQSGRKDEDGNPIYWDKKQNPTKYDFYEVDEIDFTKLKLKPF